MARTGRCYCGEIHYQAEGTPMMKAQCHCRQCQTFSGGAPNLFMLLPADGLSYTKGTPRNFTRSDLENPVTRQFCGTCGTQLVTLLPQPGAIALKIGTLDDPTEFGAAQMAIYTVDCQPFHIIPDGMPAFERLPPR